MTDTERALTGMQNLRDSILHDYIRETDQAVGTIDDAIKLLKEQQHWIPISERKPKSNGVYIVSRWVSDGCERLILADASYFDGTDTWYDDTKINYDAIYDSDRIVAWMPLPEPYRTNT